MEVVGRTSLDILHGYTQLEILSIGVDDRERYYREI